jgi:hypothetical protein
MRLLEAMNVIGRLGICVICLACAGCGGGSAVGAGLTGLAVHSELNNTLDHVDQIRSSLDGDVKTSLDKGTSGLREALKDFDEAAGKDIGQPLDHLAQGEQQLGFSLDRASKNLDMLLADTNQDLLGNVGVFAAAVQTAALDIKSGMPSFGGNSTAPRVFYAQFPGLIPGKVPDAGGRFEIVGWHLWSPGHLPKTEFLDEDRQHVIATPSAGEGRDENTLSVELPHDLMSAHGGQSVQIALRGGLSGATLYLPLVVPFGPVQAHVTGFIAYSCSGVKRQAWGEPKEVIKRNGSLEHELQVNDLLVWDVPQGWQIVEPVVEEIEVYRAERVKATVVGRDRISVAGTITVAKPTSGTLGMHLDKASMYHVKIQPKVEIPVVNQKTGTAAKDVSLSEADTNVILDVGTEATSDAPNVNSNAAFWYSVQLLINGKPLGVPLVAPRVEVGQNGGGGDLYQLRNLAVHGTCNTRIVDGKMQVTVELLRRNTGSLAK